MKTSNPLALIFVKVFPYAFMSIFVFLYYHQVGKYYNMVLEAPLGSFVLSSILFILATCFLGIIVSIIVPNQLKATEILMVIAMPSFLISGFTWPLSQMPEWIQGVSDVLPLSHFLKIFRMLFIEKGDISYVTYHVKALAILMSIFFVVTYIVLYIKIKLTLKKNQERRCNNNRNN